MQDYFKFSVFFNPDDSPCVLFIEYFSNGSFVKKSFFSRSFDWFWQMIVDHAPFYILDNKQKYHRTFYCFNSPACPECLSALAAIMEEHQEDIEEALPF